MQNKCSSLNEDPVSKDINKLIKNNIPISDRASPFLLYLTDRQQTDFLTKSSLGYDNLTFVYSLIQILYTSCRMDNLRNFNRILKENGKAISVIPPVSKDIHILLAIWSIAGIAAIVASLVILFISEMGNHLSLKKLFTKMRMKFVHKSVHILLCVELL